MNKSELKEKAIEALSESGSLYQAERFQEALEKANEAWESYFELQKIRVTDEDFSDLIYAARAQYEKCKTALDNAKQAPKSQEEELQAAIHRMELGFNGDAKAGILAAIYFTNEENWAFLDEKGHDKAACLENAARLFRKSANTETLHPEYRAFAAYRLGRMRLLPMFGKVDMREAFFCFNFAASQLLDNNITDNEELLKSSIDFTIETAMYCGDVETAMRYAGIAMEHGADMGAMFYIAYWGLFKKQSSAPSLINAMVEKGTWQGLLLKAISLMWEWEDSKNADDEKYGQITEIVNTQLSKYYDEHPDTEGGNACLGFCILKLFLDKGLPFLEDDMMQYLRDSVNAGYVWSYNFYGQLCGIAAYCYLNQGDTEQADHYREEAEKFLRRGADLGNREALKFFYYNFIKGKADTDLTEIYSNAAQQYCIAIDQ